MERLLSNLLKLVIRREDGIKRQRLASVFAVGKVLDIGTSQCPNAFLKNSCVVGLDVLIPEKKPSNYTAFIQGDCTNLRTYTRDEMFDTVIALEVIEHLPNWVEFFREAYQVLNHKGRLIVSTPQPTALEDSFGKCFLPERYIL